MFNFHIKNDYEKKVHAAGFDVQRCVQQLILCTSDKEQYDRSCLKSFRDFYDTHLIFHPHFSMQHQLQFSLTGPICSVPQGASSRAVSLRGVTLFWTGLHENNCQYVNLKHWAIVDSLSYSSQPSCVCTCATMTMSTRSYWEEAFVLK